MRSRNCPNRRPSYNSFGNLGYCSLSDTSCPFQKHRVFRSFLFLPILQLVKSFSSEHNQPLSEQIIPFLQYCNSYLLPILQNYKPKFHFFKVVFHKKYHYFILYRSEPLLQNNIHAMSLGNIIYQANRIPVKLIQTDYSLTGLSG